MTTSAITASPPDVAAANGLTQRIGFWLALHVVVWTLYATISNGPADIHHDMAEAYAWGREFQLGYFKHPPFWAWVAGVWFAIMPRADWAFYLLSMLNAAAGLWAVWLIAGRLIEDRATRLMAVLLLELVPFYHFLAFKFNANTILISLWAWAIYFYLRLIEDRRARDAVMLGVVAALGLMSKYYFALLLTAFGLATLADARRWTILKSPAPWIAIITMALLLAPHIWWLAQNDFAPFHYAASTAQHARSFIAWKAVQFGIGCVLFHILVVAFLVLFSSAPRLNPASFLKWGESTPDRRNLVIVAVAPPVLTMLAALTTNVKVDTNFAIGIFPIAPALLLSAPGYRLDPRAHEWMRRGLPVFMALMLIAAPVVAYVRFARGLERADEPRREAVQIAEALWRERFKWPLTNVAGSWPYAESAPFYARDGAAYFTGLDPKLAPWITEDRARREGVAVICRADDHPCIDQARAKLTRPFQDATFAARKRHLGHDGREYRFILLMQPPGTSS